MCSISFMWVWAGKRMVVYLSSYFAHPISCIFGGNWPWPWGFSRNEGRKKKPGTSTCHQATARVKRHGFDKSGQASWENQHKSMNTRVALSQTLCLFKIPTGATQVQSKVYFLPKYNSLFNVQESRKGQFWPQIKFIKERLFLKVLEKESWSHKYPKYNEVK